MLRRAVIMVDCLLVVIALVGLALDHGHGRLALWITVALLASAQLWRHLTP